MDVSPGASSRVAFGAFELDRASGELRKHGTRVRISGQPFQILVVLLEEAGRIVGRDELHRQLWGDNTFVDFEQGLNTAINKLRQVLGDSAESPRFIETVPGRGYRFVGRVESPAPSAPVEAATHQGLARPRFNSPPVVAALLAVALGVGYMLGTRASQPPPASLTRFRVTPPPGYTLASAATRQGFAVSPNGAHLVFTARGQDGKFHTFRRDFSEASSHLVESMTAAHTLFWSPDGRDLFFAVGGSLRKGPAAAGPHRVLGEVPGRIVHGTLVTPDIALVTGNRRHSYVVRSSGTIEPLATPHAWAERLPGDRHLLYLDFGERTGLNRIRVVRFGDGSDRARDVGETNSRVLYAPSTRRSGQGHLLYVRAGRLMAQPFDPVSLQVTREPRALAAHVAHFSPSGAADFSVSDNGVLVYQPYVGRSQMTWVDRGGRQPAAIGPSNTGLMSFRLSPDGTKIVADIYDVEAGYAQIWTFDAATGHGRRIIRDASGVSVWSPDSERLVYSGVPLTMLPKLFVTSLLEESLDEQLVPEAPLDEMQIPTDWSGDGRFIAYEDLLQGDVGIVDLARSSAVTPILDSSAFERGAVFSPDGRWMAFLADDSGRSEVYLQAFESRETPRLHGERIAVSSNGALAIRWRRDGRELLYVGTDARMYAVPVSLGPPIGLGAPEPLFAVDLEAVLPYASSFCFEVSPDGRRFLLPTISDPEPNHLVVVQNWESLVR